MTVAICVTTGWTARRTGAIFGMTSVILLVMVVTYAMICALAITAMRDATARTFATIVAMYETMFPICGPTGATWVTTAGISVPTGMISAATKDSQQ